MAKNTFKKAQQSLDKLPKHHYFPTPNTLKKAQTLYKDVNAMLCDENLVLTVEDILDVKDILGVVGDYFSSDEDTQETDIDGQNFVANSMDFFKRHQTIIKEANDIQSQAGDDRFLLDLLESPLVINASKNAKKSFAHFILGHPDLWYDDAQKHDYTLLQRAMTYRQNINDESRQKFKDNGFDAVVSGENYKLSKPVNKNHVTETYELNGTSMTMTRYGKKHQIHWGL